MIARLAILITAFAAFAGPSLALSLEACTHGSHWGEERHRDLGGGRVLFVEWWAQEGVYTDFVVADCGKGTRLTTRAREERIGDRLPIFRTQAVARIIDTHAAASPALFSLDVLAEALDGIGRDTRIAELTDEPCACAALYPELRGARIPYQETQE